MKTNNRLNRLWRILGWLMGLTLIMTLGAKVHDTYASSRLLMDFPAPGDFVTVNDASMHYVCMGEGEPTLVLEAGIGGDVLDWSPIMPALSENHRVCAFDRFGQGWSDPASSPRTFSMAADELHAALEILEIKNPVLVGHSLGGALVQIYAAKYEAAGVILVEGLTADVADTVVQRLGSYQSLEPFVRLGLMYPLGQLMSYPAYPPEVRRQMVALRSVSKSLIAIGDEGAAAAETAGDELRAAETKLNSPLLIIAAEKSNVPGLPVGEFANAARALSERKPGSVYVLISDASHYIQADHPEEVVMAMEDWLKK